MLTTVAMSGPRDSFTVSPGKRRHDPGTKNGAMEYSGGWTPVRRDEPWDEERLLMESELELQIWRWALLEAHLWEASQVYESLMGSPFAPRTQGNLMHYSPEGWHLTEGKSAADGHRRHNGRSQGRRQRRRTLQHQRRSSRFPRQSLGTERSLE